MRVPLTISDFIDRAEFVYPDRTAVVDEPGVPGSLGRLSYGDLAARARGMAVALDGMGVEHGERVAIVSPNAARFLISFYGVSAYGRVLVPVNFRLHPDEVSYIVEHSGAKVLYVDPELKDSLAGVKAEHVFVLGDDDDLYAEGVEPQPWEADENATATINYTSGTTARPKGVQITHRNIWTNAVTFALHAGVTDRDVYLHTLPMFHANGWGMPFAMTGCGVPQVALRKVDGAEILRRVERYGVTVMCAAPAVVAAVLDAAPDWDGEIPGRGRTRIIVAGAPPPTKTVARVEAELGWEFVQIYGLTETSPLLTVNRSRSEWDDLDPEERAQKLVRAGTPAIGVSLQVDDEGEVLARSNVCLEGYWDQPELTARVLRPHPFLPTELGDVERVCYSGDYVKMDEEGFLYFIGRRDTMIKSSGFRISPTEVEEVLFKSGHLKIAAVIGVPDEVLGQTVKAFVVAREGVDLKAETLREFCAANMPRHMVPKAIEVLDQMPRTTSGKVDYPALRRREGL